MNEDRRPQEPSMEEILSSIRQQIITDQPPPRPAPENAPLGAPEGRSEEVLELTDIIHEPARRPAASPGPAGGFVLGAAREKAVPTPPPPLTHANTDSLVSETTGAAASGAFARLAQAAAAGQAPPRREGQPRTMEEAVLELLKPMLREWLDKNLPGIVERIVEEEVKRLVRRAELG
jgi:cell pole-organizing protein PopZ